MRRVRHIGIAGSMAAVLVLSLATATPAAARTQIAPKITHAASFTAHGSIGQAYVLGARRGSRLELVDARRHVVATGRADRFGSKIFRGLRPGGGYTVRQRSGRRVDGTHRFGVLRAGANPPQSFYRHKRLHAGLNYVAMRDGVKLAMTVRLPAGKTLADGPFPTLIEDSGYQIAAPHDLLASVVKSLQDPTSTPDPLAPDTATAVGSLIAPMLGYAVVSMQMRGTGCSGGAFDLFGLPTTYDGYDAVETVAAQPWVRGKVGLAGISFSGISQLFVAGTQPPHLAAIAPMSVTDDLYTGTGYPGGIFNSGFALSWLKDRVHDAQPAPGSGQPYARALVRAGDRQCAANQKLRLQTLNVFQLIRENPFRTPSLFDQRSPGAWMKRIRVPTFLIGQFQDEQTGGHFAESLANLSDNRNVWITLQNGVHVDSLGPNSLTRWVEFLDLFVAHRVPRVPPSVLGLSTSLYKVLADAGAAPVAQSRFAGTTSVAADTAIFKRDPRVRLLMDNGAGPQGPGSIGSTWELDYSSWPPRQARATTYYLGRRGALQGIKPPASGPATYVADPHARPAQTLPGNGDADAWKAQPRYHWAPIAPHKGLGFISGRLTRDVVIAGPSSLDVYLKSSARDTDLQVTLSEVRPDGQETYVQNGWLRASHRKLSRRLSTVVDPVPTHLRQDARWLPRDRYSLVRVPIFPVAHAFRAGSRIRVTIEATGGDRPRWDFATVDRGRTRNLIGLGGRLGSRLVLPVVAGATAKGTPLPAPTALRGEPSRTYVVASNGG